MKFPTEPQQWPDGQPSMENMAPTCLRWQSEGGLWRVQIDPVFAWPCYEVVYCCGPNRMSVLLLPRLVMRVLEAFREESEVYRIRDAFPRQTIKPIDLDRKCWLKLSIAAGISARGGRHSFRLIESNRDTAPPIPSLQMMLAGAMEVP